MPNQIAEFDKLKSTNSSIFETIPVKPGEKGDPLPTGKVNPDYLVKDANGRPVVERNVIIDNGGYKMETFSQKVNIEAIKAADSFQSTITAQAVGLLDANQSSAIDFYNDIMSNPQGRWKGTGFSFDPNKPLDEEGKKKFIEDYKEYYVNTQIAPTQTINKPNSDEVTLIEKAEKPKSLKGGVKGAKPTAAEKSQKALNSEINDAVRYGGTVKGKNGLYLKVKGGEASVYKLDSDGFETPITLPGSSLNDMVVQIGGTLNKKAKLKG